MPSPPPEPPLVARAIAGALRAQGLDAVAFLPVGDRVFWSRGPEDPKGPASAVTRLVQGLYDLDVAVAHLRLRQRIYTTDPAGARDACMVRVAARRLTTGVQPWGTAWPSGLVAEEVAPAPLPPAPSLGPDLLPPCPDDAAYLSLAARLAAQARREGPAWGRDRAVGAVLVDGGGRILGMEVNRNARNRTLHAEVLLCQRYWAATRRPLPAGARIYTSLAPCRMCAALIWHLAGARHDLRVVYSEADPGRLAQGTMLAPRSPDRRRFTPPEEWDLAVMVPG